MYQHVIHLTAFLESAEFQGSDETHGSQAGWSQGNSCCQGYVLKVSGARVYMFSLVAFLEKFASVYCALVFPYLSLPLWVSLLRNVQGEQVS